MNLKLLLPLAAMALAAGCVSEDDILGDDTAIVGSWHVIRTNDTVRSPCTFGGDDDFDIEIVAAENGYEVYQGTEEGWGVLEGANFRFTLYDDWGGTPEGTPIGGPADYDVVFDGLDRLEGSARTNIYIKEPGGGDCSRTWDVAATRID
jgi:hypothetical protein